MTNDELRHHGIKGQQWGRRRYQNKDGSLTKAGEKRYNKELDKIKAEKSKLAKQAKVLRERKKTKAKFDKLEQMKSANEIKKKALEAEGNELKGKTKKVKPEEPKSEAQKAAEIAARRQKLLKSSNPQELYKNRDLLTTDEINERLYRISTEQRLGQVAASTKKSGKDYFDKFVKGANKVYEFSQTPAGKALLKKAGLGGEDDKFDIDKIVGKMDKMSADDLKKYAGMTKNMESLRSYQEKHGKKKPEEKTDDPEVEKVKGKVVDDFPWASKNDKKNNANSRSSVDDIIDGYGRDVTPTTLPAVYRDRGSRIFDDYYNN